MFQIKNFTIKPCNSRTAFEFVPTKEVNLDLAKISKRLKAKKVFVEIETNYLLMLKLENKNMTLFKSGKIIVKETKEKEEAKNFAEKLLKKIGEGK